MYTGAPGLGGTGPPAGGALRGGGGAAEDGAGGPFGGVTGCCAPGAPAAAPLRAGRTRPTGGGGSMRSAAALGSVFSGSSTSPSSGAAKPMPYHYPFLQNPKVMRSVLGGLAVRQAEPKVAEARQMQSEHVEAVGQELLQLTATPRLKLRPLGPEPLGRALGLLPLPVLPWPAAPYLAEPNA